jgi:hypothetical protein
VSAVVSLETGAAVLSILLQRHAHIHEDISFFIESHNLGRSCVSILLTLHGILIRFFSKLNATFTPEDAISKSATASKGARCNTLQSMLTYESGMYDLSAYVKKGDHA